ncbi:CHAT domain-containing WD40 repeat protein [Blastococcus saxobsidens]|uniref:CHAT domain-containing protein n=1 Tax=Blastococcus saxobsidens (strain DD2) TaxID=1146883 RepID=H6RJX0_BLASD|nr:CHAT domain-containing protein [Blastococcus saxobsidens]CCG03623.1 protein of unknown function, putative WD40 repeat and coiled-coil domains [Blastococcus saxobsidens DD2]
MGDISFRLDVVESDDTWVVFCDSPFGRTVQKLPAPFSGPELERRLTAVEKSLVRSSAHLVTRRAAAPERTAQDFGAELSRALLTGRIRILFARCREKAREQGVDLRVLVNPDGPGVSRIPWEFVIDPDRDDDYLALRLPVARSPHLMEPVAPLPFAPPLRVLGILSRPADLPALDAERERADLTRALNRLSTDMVEIQWLPGDRWSDLAEAIRSRPWHVLHFVGHGGFDEDQESGYLELSDDQGHARPILATDLGRLLAANHDLRLVVLNACESAVTGAGGFFSSTAAKLMREGVPAVVAMQYEITDAAALAFSSSFYEGLARGLPVDQAVRLARESVKMTMTSLEWATPVLFLASEETHLFSPPSRSDERGVVPAATGTYGGSGMVQAGADWLGATRMRLAQTLRAGEASGSRTATGSGPSAGRDSPSGAGTAAAPSLPPRPAAARDWVDGPDLRGRPEAMGQTGAGRLGTPDVREPDGGASVPAADRIGALQGVGSCSHAAVGPRDLVALACSDGVVRIVSPRSGRCLAQCALPGREPARRVAWGPWPRHVASTHDGGLVVVWDLETEVPVRVLRAASRRVEAVAFSGDGRWLAAAGERRLRVYDSNGAQVRDLPVPPDASVHGESRGLREISAVAFSPDDRHVCMAGDDGMARQFDVQGRVTAVWRHPTALRCMDVAPDRLVTGSAAGRASVWGWSGALLHRTEQGASVDLVAFAADGGLLATAGADRTLCVWGRHGQAFSRTTLSRSLKGLRFRVDGSLLTVDSAGRLEIWRSSSEGSPA